MNAAVSIIIPTAGATVRRKMLWRAIQSILDQDWEGVEIIVVVNGTRFDQTTFDELRSKSNLQVMYQAEPSLAMAQRTGRLAVSTPFFGFLDDDDVYLPGAIRTRIEPMLADYSVDAVVTNGFRRTENREDIIVNNFDSARADPLHALLSVNWLASCGGLFRTATIGESYFDGQTKHFEWTMVALRISCDEKKICFLDQPTYRVNVTPGSLSSSGEYRAATAKFLESVMNRSLPRKVRTKLLRKLSAAYHNLAEVNRAAGKLKEARRFHLRSLALPGGLRYLSYSRKLVFRAAACNIDTQKPS